MKFIPERMREAKVVQVIKTVHLAGEGVEESIAREVIRYWTLGGELLAESDPCPEETGEPCERHGVPNCPYCGVAR